MMINTMMRNLRLNLERLDKSQQNLASGKKFVVPSDDPIGVSRSLRLNTEISMMDQFKRNANDIQSWMDTTEQALNNIISVIQRARELTVQATSETNSIDERKAIAAEIKELREQLISLGNSTYAGRYLFSGYKTDQPLLKTDGTYDLGGMVLNSSEIINLNVGIGDQIGTNILGQRIFGLLNDPVADLDGDVNLGRYNYVLKAENAFSAYTAGAGETISINYNNQNYNITIAAGNYNDAGEMAKAINDAIGNVPELAGHISADVVNGRISFTSDEALSIDTAASTPALIAATGITNDTAVQSVYTLRGELIQDLTANTAITVDAAHNSFVINYNGVSHTITLDIKTYDGGAGNTLDDLVADIQGKINSSPLAGHVNVVNHNGRLIFDSDGKISFKNTTTNSFDIRNIGLSETKASVYSGQNVKSGDNTQLIGVFDQLIKDLESDNTDGIKKSQTRLDTLSNNIIAIRSEIGVKSNRVELTINRIEDDTVNLKELLSKNEDADIAEVIMMLKMQENVYRASLSGGARIIQPSLVDFLR